MNGHEVIVPNGAGFAPHVQHGGGIVAQDVSEILAGLARLEERVGGLSARIDIVTSSAVTRHELADVERRLASMEASASRLVWMVLTAVVTALLGLVVGAGMIGGAP